MRLTELMARRNLNRSQIAEQADVSISVVSKLLRGISQPSRATIDRLRAAYPELSGAGIYQDYESARVQESGNM